MSVLLRLGLATATLLLTAAAAPGEPAEDKFKQLDGHGYPAPSVYRTASGAPGPKYWQQYVGYRIQAKLDEPAKQLSGQAQIVYRNNSPDTLPFLWVMLDQPGGRQSVAELVRTAPSEPSIELLEVRRQQRLQEWQGGFRDLKVSDENGNPLPTAIVDSAMRIDLPQPLLTGEQVHFSISWRYSLNEAKVVGGRAGYECFEGAGQGGSCIYELGQWYPRMAAYSDYEGWHNKGFVGSEFALEFSDFDVLLTVPSDHVVAATGVLQNPEAVLTSIQRERLLEARRAAEPVYVITPEEAQRAERSRASSYKTWNFAAQNVRDFAAASSRKYIWDAMGVSQDDPEMPLVLAMSFYSNEARPIWNVYSTKAIAHSVRTFGSLVLPYPYPVVQAAFGPVGGMEYPMLTFIGNRPNMDPESGRLTYGIRAKNGFLDNIFHEVGHNWFPMIVNSDEREWEWMDEGLTSYIQFQAEKLWDPAFPSRRGEPRDLAPQLLAPQQTPIMTQADMVVGSGLVSYAKTATALTILRETILGRESFDRAFKEYARRWRFKRPTPGDFFRTIEEVSGADLDWFWRGWFYTTDYVDLALSRIVEGRVNSGDPDAEAAYQREQEKHQPVSLAQRRNATRGVIASDPSIRDFYNEADRFTPTNREREAARAARSKLRPEERTALSSSDKLYRFSIENKGGLLMPIILRLSFADGSSDTVRIPVQVWRRNSERVVWQYITPKRLSFAEIDPDLETADSDVSNNRFPQQIERQTFDARPDTVYPDRMRDSDIEVTRESVRPRGSARQ